MRVRFVTIALFAVLTSPVFPAEAQNPSRHIVVTREGGPRIERGSIHGYDEVRYKVAAETSGLLRITLKGALESNLFNVYAPGTQPGKDEAIFRGDLGGTTAKVPVSKAGEYLIQVFLMRNAARRGSTSRYTLSVELTR